MLDLIILIILGFGFLIGLKRGFILQIIHLTGFIIAFIIAYLYYDQLAPKLTLWVPFPNFSSDSDIITCHGKCESRGCLLSRHCICRDFFCCENHFANHWKYVGFYCTNSSA